MPLRLFRRVQIVPGLRVNLSKGGLSLAIGRRGAWYTTGPRGRRVTAGGPGTGLFLTQQSPPAITTPIGELTPPQPTRVGRRLAVALMVLAGLAMLIWAIVAASH